MFKTLDDYILDTQRKEAPFLSGWRATPLAQWVQQSTQSQVEWVIAPAYSFVTKDWQVIPCHNKGTYNYYKNNNY